MRSEIIRLLDWMRIAFNDINSLELTSETNIQMVNNFNDKIMELGETCRMLLPKCNNGSNDQPHLEEFKKIINEFNGAFHP
ncbi:MAG: hypothetical protein JSR33_12000 [Proteobacteria bacterium]|nr:hypothetical protein [Pseudomonadota bacterium]